jgi:hypothetical protein
LIMLRNPIYILIILAAVLTVLFSSCDPYSDDSYREYVVIESYLVAERRLPDVHVSTTLPIDEVYTFEDAAVTDATVTLHVLGEADEIEQSYNFIMTDPGVYRSNAIHIVEPRRSYRLDVEIEGRGLITAQTTVPDTFRVTGQVPETIIYQSDQQLELTITPNFNPGRQNVYVFNTIADEPEYENLTPFYKSIYDNDDQSDLQDFRNNASNLINEGNFQIDEEGFIELRFPWIGVAFYGENQIVTNSLDRNIFDFIRSQDVQLGGSTLAPGEIPNAIYNIDGGIGVFGSLAADTVRTNFSRPPGL